MTWYGLVLAKARGEQIAENMAIDQNGNPTTDPEKVMNGGALLPFDRRVTSLDEIKIHLRRVFTEAVRTPIPNQKDGDAAQVFFPYVDDGQVPAFTFVVTTTA